MPATGERLPRKIQALDRKVTEISLEQLAFIIAELHVEVAVKLTGLVFLRGDSQCFNTLKYSKVIYII